MRNKSKSKLVSKRRTSKRNLSFKEKKSRSRRRSLAPLEKQKRCISRSKWKEKSINHKKKEQTQELTDSSSDNDRRSDRASTVKRRRIHFKKESLGSDDLESPKERRNKKERFFKNKFKRTQAELIQMKSRIYELEFNLESKINELSLAEQEASELRKKLKNYKYYRDKTKEYKTMLKEASIELQDLQIQNNSNCLILFYKI